MKRDNKLNLTEKKKIIVLGQEKTLHNFHVELPAFKSPSFHSPSLAGILWT